jgi:hypothetical protein
MLSEAVSKFLGIEELPVHPDEEPRSRFCQPPWEAFMGEKYDAATIGQIAPMLRYLYAKIEMLEQKLDARVTRPQHFHSLSRNEDLSAVRPLDGEKPD